MSADLVGALTTLEAACRSTQSLDREARSQGTQAVLGFRATADSVLCRYVLENGSAETRIEALKAVREGVERGRAAFEATSMLPWLLHLLLDGSRAPEAMVARELINTTAHVTKCGWGSMSVEARAELVRHLTQQSSAAQASSQRAVELLVAIVSAFASTSMRVTSLAAPVDYHVSCHIAFQTEGYLLHMCKLSASLIAQSLTSANQPLLKSSLGLLLEVLSWNFDSKSLQDIVLEGNRSRTISAKMGEEDDDDDGGDGADSADDMSATLHCIGEEWQTLFAPLPSCAPGDTLQYLCFQAFEAAGNDTLLTTLAGRTLVRLAGVSRQLFVSEEHRLHVLSTFLLALTHLASNCASHAWLSIAQVVRRLLCNFTGRELWAVSGLAAPFLETICNLACGCAMRLSGDEDKTWFSDVFGHLLAAWVSLASVEESSREPAPWYSQAVIQCSWRIFECYVSSRLIIARQECDEEADEYEDQEHLDDEVQAVAFLGRVCTQESFQFIGSLLGSISNDLIMACAQVTAAGERTAQSVRHRVNELREELCWLVTLLSRLLTESDGDSGETPIVPQAINTFVALEYGIVVIDVVKLVFRLLEWENEILRSSATSDARLFELSPLVSVSLRTFLRRWSETYLFPDPRYTSPELLSVYGSEQTQGGMGLLSFVIDTSILTLMYYRWDDDVCISAAQLLLSLSKRSTSQTFGSIAHIAHTLPQWPQLMQCFQHNPTAIATSEPASFSIQLSATGKRILTQAVIQFSASLDDSSFVAVVDPCRLQFLELISGTSADMVKHPQLMSSVLHYIEVMHGMASAGARTSASNSRIYQQLATMLPALPLILQAYGRDSPAHILAILRLYLHVADSMLDGMSGHHIDHFLAECATLFSTYFMYCRFTATVTAAALADTQRHEQYQETLSCLKLLCCLVEWMRADAENARGGGTFWRLLELVLPSIFAAPDLMQHRKLALALFYTIHSLFELVPMISTLPLQQFCALMNCVTYGMTHSDSIIERLSFECLEMLLAWNHQYALQFGAPGLQQLLQADNSILKCLLTKLLDILLLGNFSLAVLPVAADCLLIFLADEQPSFQERVGEILATQPEHVQALLVQQFQNLTAQTQVHGGLALQRSNRQEFCTKLRSFLQTCRPIVVHQ